MLTDTSDHDNMPILPLPHYRQNCLDDVDVGEKVDLENLIHQTYSTTALCKLLDSANHSLNEHQSAKTQDL
jgi:hypothetical protein